MKKLFCLMLLFSLITLSSIQISAQNVVDYENNNLHNDEEYFISKNLLTGEITTTESSQYSSQMLEEESSTYESQVKYGWFPSIENNSSRTIIQDSN